MKLTLHKRHYLILITAFLISVLLRVPNLNRPLSKHHDFNTAVILNGIISWKEGGGAANFGYIPIMSYQGAANQTLVRAIYTDSLGNQLYLSLGAGWYALPYVVFTALHLPFTPLSLQLLNLCIHLFTLMAVYWLGRVIVKQYVSISPHFPLYTALIFLFLPGPLWFYGNGYVHNAVSLPFAISLFTLFLQFVFGQAKRNVGNLVLFALLGITGIYFDWFTFFLLATIGVYSFSLFIKTKQQSWLPFSLFCGGVAAIAVGLVFWQFVHFLSVQQVKEYWANRAAVRTMVNEKEGVPEHIAIFFKNMLTCSGIALVGVGLAFFFRKKEGFPTVPLLLWLGTCGLYNGLFFDWSYSHDFSMVPLGVGVSMCTAYLLLQVARQRTAIGLLLLCVANVGHYYFVNRPGTHSRNGDAYNRQMLLGQEIKRRIPADARIFSNGINDPISEYYAHRSFVLNKAATPAEARRLCDSFQVPKAVWINIDSFRIKELQVIR